MATKMYLFAIVLQPHIEMDSDEHIIVKYKTVISLLYLHHLFMFSNALYTRTLALWEYVTFISGPLQLQVFTFHLCHKIV